MTREEQRIVLLIGRIKDNCYEVAKKFLKEYSEQIRADAIEEFVETLKEPITLDELTRSRDRIKTFAIIKYKAGILKGDFKEGE